jgi:hypothetical protein
LFVNEAAVEYISLHLLFSLLIIISPLLRTTCHHWTTGAVTLKQHMVMFLQLISDRRLDGLDAKEVILPLITGDNVTTEVITQADRRNVCRSSCKMPIVVVRLQPKLKVDNVL